MTKEQAEKQLVQSRKDFNRFCPVINGPCKAPDCMSYVKGHIYNSTSLTTPSHDERYACRQAMCNHPFISGILYTDDF